MNVDYSAAFGETVNKCSLARHPRNFYTTYLLDERRATSLRARTPPAGLSALKRVSVLLLKSAASSWEMATKLVYTLRRRKL